MHGRFWHGLVIPGALLASVSLAQTPALRPVQPDALQRERLAQIRVPFVENCGQWDQQVAFAARASFGTVFVTNKGQLVYSLPGDSSDGWSLTETFVSGKPVPQPGQPDVTRVSYFHGSDQSRWQSGLSTYGEIRLGQVWPGVSVALRARGKTVEKVFTVEPGAEAAKIRLRVHGATSLLIDRDGALVAATGLGEVRFTKPEAYQERGGTRRPVEVAYVLHGYRYGFRLGSYDHALPVVIDPLLQSTYLGGTFGEGIEGSVIHPATGEMLVAGSTDSTDFPGTTGGAQSTSAGPSDAFVARLDPALTTLLQATYLGGGADDYVFAITLDPTTGDVLVAGGTNSSDFPGTTGGAQSTFGGGPDDAFAARLDPALTTLLQATYLGGSGLNPESIMAIAVHPSTGDILVAGSTSSTDFPETAGGAQPAYGGGWWDAFVARLNPALTVLLQASYLGGGNIDGWLDVDLAVDPSTGEVFVAGDTWSTDFPGTAGGAQPSLNGFEDCFIARLDPTLTTLLQATHLGGSVDAVAWAIAIHPSTGELLVAGYTDSTDFPGTVGGAQSTSAGPSDAFVARLDPTLTALLQATYLGGAELESIWAITVSPSTGDVLVAGGTSSSDFPGTAGGAQSIFGGGDRDAFVARLNSALTDLLQSTYLGGSEADGIETIALNPSTEDVLVAGYTGSVDFPGATGGAQPAYGGGVWDSFVVRLTPDLAALLSPVGLTLDSVPNPGDGDFVFEPGEEVPVITSWKNWSTDPYSPNGQASDFTGPAGADYTIVDDSVSYGTISPGSTGTASDGYRLSVSSPAVRPATHWDATFTETLDVQYVLPFRRTLHIGDSFPDVPRSNLFYRFIENVLHHGITAGCGSGNYCPDSPVTRAQMAVFLLKSKHGSGYVPSACAGVFADVICPSQFADWIEELFNEGITGGCGGGNYCPDNAVTRAQMAVFLLKSEHGSGHVPPGCTGVFSDVTCPSMFADWIEQLATENITGGCGGGNYCPDNPNTRGQMAAFLVKTFGLQLYGP
jgi:hypothetical protein